MLTPRYVGSSAVVLEGLKSDNFSSLLADPRVPRSRSHREGRPRGVEDRFPKDPPQEAVRPLSPLPALARCTHIFSYLLSSTLVVRRERVAEKKAAWLANKKASAVEEDEDEE